MKRLLVLLSALYSLLSTFSFAQPGTWTWMKGDSVFNYDGNYGTMGDPDPANAPPARYSPTRWRDHDGNFWLYGGYGTSEFFGDLWKYDVTNNEWTWMNGTTATNEIANYGVLGVSSPNNFPGCRGWGGASWVDINGDLWLFGGKGFGSFPNAAKMLSDLWRYNIATNEWTWMKGTAGDSTHFGIFQVSDSMNSPGIRMEVSANWTDSTGLWFYGGVNGALKQDRNDMWRFDINLNEWTWMSGDTLINIFPNLGTQYIFSPTNTPGGRMTHCAWQDTEGKFWLFGGHSDFYGPDWADLWQYDPVINQWAWISGSIDSSQGNFGTVCDTSNEFFPKGRWENRLSWMDDCGNLWLFGGQRNTNSLNDLWVYSPLKNIWSFASGTQNTNDDGHYGIKGVADDGNLPPSRMGGAAWQDEEGSFWLFGGSQTTSQTQFYSDLWRFIPDTTCPQGIGCNIATLTPTVFTGDEILIFPNPNDGNFQIEWLSAGQAGLNSPLSESVSLRIVNIAGVEVFSLAAIRSDDWRSGIDLDDFERGIYFIEIRIEDEFLPGATQIVRKKMIVVK